MDANQKQNNSEIKWLYKVLVWGLVYALGFHKYKFKTSLCRWFNKKN